MPKGHGVVEEETPPELQGTFTITDEEAAEVVKIGKTLETHFGTPQDLEWTIDTDRPFPGNIWLLQTRGVVGVKVQEKKTVEQKLKEELAKRLKRVV